MSWTAFLAVFDRYTIFARIVPAAIATAPAIAGLAALFWRHGMSIASWSSTLLLVFIAYAMFDKGRELGKALEPRLYARLGGKPSTKLLRRGESVFDDPARDRFRNFLAAALDRPVPTSAEEAADRARADGFYDAAGDWLRTKTRDTKKFPILFADLCSYGYRRNLLGLKPVGLLLNLVVVGVSLFAMWRIGWTTVLAGDTGNIVLMVLVFAVLHSAFLVGGVTWKGVESAAMTYGAELIRSTEIIMADRPASKKSRKKATNAA